jgi:iron complex outermembrane receptor protein
MRRTIPTLILICCAGLGGHAVAAEADKLSDMERLLSREVTGPSRFTQTLGDSPAAVALVSGDEIGEFGFRTLGEALLFAPSTYITSDRAYTYLGTRGFSRPGDYNSRVLLLADGIPLNDPIFDQAPLGHEAPIDVGWLKLMEFAQGPSSAPNGGNALFGVINAQVLDGQDIDGRHLSLGLGNRGERQARLLAGGVTDGGADWMIGLSHADREGEDLFFSEFVQPGVSDGWARGLDGERFTKLIGKLSHGAWQTHLIHSERSKDIPTAYYDTEFNAPGTRTDDQYDYLGVHYTDRAKRDLEQHFRIYAGRYSFEADYRYDYGVNRDTASASWWGGEYKAIYSGIRDHALAAGFDARLGTRTRQQNFDVDTGESYLDDSRREDRIGLFLEDRWQVAEAVSVDLGLRLDRQESREAVASPRLALVYRPRPTTSLKLIYGVGYRQPNTYERFYGDSGYTQKGNAGLSSERIQSFELVLDHLLSPRLHLGFNAYRYRLEDLISQSTDPNDGLLVFTNEPAFHIDGAEFLAMAVLDHGLNARASLALQEADGATTLYNAPDYIGKVFLDGPLGLERWTFNLGIEAIGERNTLGGRVGSATRLDLSLHREVPGGEVAVFVYNTLDSDARVPTPTGYLQDSLPVPGRQVSIVWKTAL